MSDAEENLWAKKLVDDNAWVMHIGARVIGRVTRFFDGKGSVHVSSVNNQPVQGPVLQLEQGHAFVATPDAFIRLSEVEAEFYRGAQLFVAGALAELMMVARTQGIRLPTANILTIAALRTQASTLEAEHANFFVTAEDASEDPGG